LKVVDFNIHMACFYNNGPTFQRGLVN